MTGARMADLLRQAVAALTVDEIEVHDAHGLRTGDAVALLDRSIGHDLVRIERAMSAHGPTLLSATAGAIDEALLVLAEALALAEGEQP